MAQGVLQAIDALITVLTQGFTSRRRSFLDFTLHPRLGILGPQARQVHLLRRDDRNRSGITVYRSTEESGR